MSLEALVRRRWANEEFLVARVVSAKLAATSGLRYAGPVGAGRAYGFHAAEQKHCLHAGLDLVVPPTIFGPCGCVLPERQDQAATALPGTQHGGRRQAAQRWRPREDTNFKEAYYTDEIVEADRNFCLKADVEALLQKSSEAIDSECVSATEAVNRAICKCLEDEHAAEVREGGTWPATFGAALGVAETCCPGPPVLGAFLGLAPQGLPGAGVAASPSSASEDGLPSARLSARDLVRPRAVAPPASGAAGRLWPCCAGAESPQEPSMPPGARSHARPRGAAQDPQAVVQPHVDDTEELELAHAEVLAAQLFPDGGEEEAPARPPAAVNTEPAREHPPAAAPLASSVAGRPWPCRAGAGAPQEAGVPARPSRAVVWCARSTQALGGLGDQEHRALLDGMGAEAQRLESITFESVSKLDRWLCTQERGADVVPWAALVVGWREANAAFDLVEAVATGCTGRLRPDCRRNLRPITGWPGSWEVNTAVSSVIVLAEGQQQCERAAAKITQRVFCSGSSHEQQQDPVSSSAWKLQVGANMGFPQLCTVEVLLAHDLVGLRAALRTVARA